MQECKEVYKKWKEIDWGGLSIKVLEADGNFKKHKVYTYPEIVDAYVFLPIRYKSWRYGKGEYSWVELISGAHVGEAVVRKVFLAHIQTVKVQSGLTVAQAVRRSIQKYGSANNTLDFWDYVFDKGGSTWV